MAVDAGIQKKLDADTAWGGALATVTALCVGYLTDGVRLSLPIWGLLSLGVIIVWACLVVIGRVAFARRRGEELRGSPVLLHWVGARLALAVAAWALFIGWLVALPFGKPWSGITGRALLFIIAVSAINRLVGHATINSAILLARLRRFR
uniref:hypothetical protein n=1 Tax=Altererythrobacter segetis TaxID=1104773 RepID=UPI00140D4A81|nr:hypothetical protein [Altererythrobacter segetis]